jgi:hypothetical protein
VTPTTNLAFDPSAVWMVLPWLAAAAAVLVWLWRQAGTAQPRAAHWGLRLLRGAAIIGLLVVGANPVRVAITPGAVHRPEVQVLLDASQSMRLGTPQSRWDEGLAVVREALDRQNGHADVRVHRFGERLVSVDAAAVRSPDFPLPDDGDTQLAPALRQLAGRLGRDAPAGLVIVSDGRVRDPDKLDEMAGVWRRLRVPVHVVPVGREGGGGDAAIVAAVAPAKARKQSQVTVHAFLRSFGFAGRRSELRLQSLDDAGNVRRTLASIPITLHDGVQPVSLAFQTEPGLKRMRLYLPPAPGELSVGNNEFPLEIELDRTKIRVLVLEGSDGGFYRAVNRALGGGGNEDSDAPYAPLRDALLADADVQCVVYQVSPGGPARRIITPGTTQLAVTLPQTSAELMAYDALVLSNVSRDAVPDELLGWIDEWIGKRGGGLLMAGGPRSFGGGGWAGTAIERMLPVEFAGASDWDGSPAALEPTGPELHPIWRLFEDERAARAALKTLPEAPGRSTWVRVKPQSGTTLAVERVAGAFRDSEPGGKTQTAPATRQRAPLLAIGAYGRGRTAALATPLSASLSPMFTRQWGEGGDNRHFAKFARNLVYWLTEDSAIGRRRLFANTDKRFYRPGETVSISGQTFDESANRTGRYRVVAMLEPRSISGPELPPSPVKWPVGRPRQPGESGPLAAWGEEIELLLDPNSKDHSLELPLTETLAGGGQGVAFKLELTAYEGQTQIDSCSLDVQVLGDPQEQQNPLPNRQFLAAFARTTGGREFTDGASLAAALTDLSVAEGASTVRRTPVWSREWLLGALIGVLSVEWFLRRWLGLA